jgi:hypothetical protein
MLFHETGLLDIVYSALRLNRLVGNHLKTVEYWALGRMSTCMECS